MELLKHILILPVAIYLLYFSIIHCMMLFRHGRNWMWHEKAWDELETIFLCVRKRLAFGKD